LFPKFYEALIFLFLFSLRRRVAALAEHGQGKKIRIKENGAIKFRFLFDIILEVTIKKSLIESKKQQVYRNFKARIMQ